MTKGGNLFHGSTIGTEKPPFYEPDDKNDGATPDGHYEGEDKTLE